MPFFSKKRYHIFCTLGVLITSWVIYGFIRARQEADIIELEFNKNNPTSYIFPFPIKTLRDTMQQWKDREASSLRGYTWRNKKTPVNSFFLKAIGGHTGSYIYRYGNKRKINEEVKQYFKYIVVLDSLSKDSTVVSVHLIDNSIIAGVKFWMNLQFTMYGPKIKKIPSSTIEEYELLRYIGKKSGCLSGMPYVKYPEELSRNEIIRLFGPDNPFTYEEMFE